MKKYILATFLLLALVIPHTSHAAIAFDAVTNFSGAANPFTFSHTVTGTNPILFVSILETSGSDSVTGVTYNGVAMTLVGKVQDSGDSRYIYLWELQAPATGTNTVSISGTASTVIGNAVSYTGAAQSGGMDNTFTNTSPAATSFSNTITSVADNTWHVAWFRSNGVTNSVSVGTARGSADVSLKFVDHNGPKTPAGSDTLTVTSSNTSQGTVGATFAPYVTPAVILTPILSLVRAFWW